MRSMKLWMSGEVDADVYDAFRAARQDVESAVAAVLARESFGPPALEWAVIPIIRSEDHPDYRELVQFHARRTTVEFRLRVSHVQFRSGTSGQQRGLLVQALLRSLSMLPVGLSASVRAAELGAGLGALARSEGWPLT